MFYWYWFIALPNRRAGHLQCYERTWWYVWFFRIPEHFEHFRYDKKNKKLLGKFKDELFSLTLEEFIGLRPKCYFLLVYGRVKENIVINLNKGEKQVAKGTKKCKKRHSRHAHYKVVLENLNQIYQTEKICIQRTCFGHIQSNKNVSYSIWH